MKKLLIKAAIAVVITCFVFSCQRTAPPFTVGDPVEITSETIGTSGGTIVVNKPGDPLDGFTIEVPAGAYDAAQTFTISYQSIESYNLPAGSVPVSPLIRVENSGQFSRQYMTVTIPASIPQDHFAMVFFYDEESLKIEGMYRVTADNGSITAGTRHFSKCAVIATPLKSLEGFIDTEFKPGQDDWQFTNYGSYIAPAGHCAGQSIMAMYYFTEKKLKEGKPGLYGTYDNDGNPYHKTPDLQHDDVLGYKRYVRWRRSSWGSMWTCLIQPGTTRRRMT